MPEAAPPATAAAGDEPPAAGGDWRSELDADARRKVLLRMMEVLVEGYGHTHHRDKLSTIASQFESQIYSESTDRIDYLQKISARVKHIERQGRQNASAVPVGQQEQADNLTQSPSMSSVTPLPGHQGSNASSVTAQRPVGLTTAMHPVSGLGNSIVTRSLPATTQSSGNRIEGFGAAQQQQNLQIQSQQQQQHQNLPNQLQRRQQQQQLQNLPNQLQRQQQQQQHRDWQNHLQQQRDWQNHLQQQQSRQNQLQQQQQSLQLLLQQQQQQQNLQTPLQQQQQRLQLLQQQQQQNLQKQQLPNPSIAYPFSPQMQMNEMLSSPPSNMTQMSPSLQSGHLAKQQWQNDTKQLQSLPQQPDQRLLQQNMQSVARRNQSQTTVAQPMSSVQRRMPSNYPNYSSPVALQFPGNASVHPSSQQSQLLRQRSSGFSMQQRPQQRTQGHQNSTMSMQQTQTGLNQQQPFIVNQSDKFQQVTDTTLMQQQNQQMHGSQPNVKVSPMDHSAAQSSLPNARPARAGRQQSAILQPQLNKREPGAAFQQNLIPESQLPTPSRKRPAISQPSSSLHHEIHRSAQSSAVVQNATEADWQEEIFQQIQLLKDAYFPELLELDQTFVPAAPKQDVLASDTAQLEAYKKKCQMKQTIQLALRLLQAEKSGIDELVKGYYPQLEKTVTNLVLQQRRRKSMLVAAQAQQLYAENRSQNYRGQAQILPHQQGFGSSDTQTIAVSEQQNQQLRRQQQQQHTQELALRNQENARVMQQQQNQKLLLQQRPPTSAQLQQLHNEQNEPSPSLSPLPANRVRHPNRPNVMSNSKLKQSLVVTRPPAQQLNSSNQLLGTSPSLQNAPLRALQSTISQFPQPIQAKPQEHNTGPLQVASPSALMKPSALPGVCSDLPDGAANASPFALMRSPTLSGACANLPDDAANGPPHAITSTPMVAPAQLSAEAIGQGETAKPAEPEQPAVPEQTAAPEPEPQVAAKKPIDSLLHAILSSSSEALRSSCNAIASTVRLSDQVRVYVQGGEYDHILDAFSPTTSEEYYIENPELLFIDGDVAAASNSKHPSEENPELPLQDGDVAAASNSKHPSDCALPNHASPVSCSLDDSSLGHDLDDSKSESSSAPDRKRRKVETQKNSPAEGEITDLNNRLIDTVISMVDDKKAESEGAAVIKFSYVAVSLGPYLKSFLAPSHTSVVEPAKLFVPADYPKSSPVLIGDMEDDQSSKSIGDISAAVKQKFQAELRNLPQPRSIGAMVKAWDACVREAITEFASRQGGGTVSSTYGSWQSCVGA